MPRRIVTIVAVLLAALTAGGLVGPSRVALSAAQEASPAATPCPATTDEESEAVVRRLFEEGWGQGNLQVVDEVVANDDIVHRAPATAGSIPPRRSPPRGRSATPRASRCCEPISPTCGSRSRT
jgi:hypothetical protein